MICFNKSFFRYVSILLLLTVLLQACNKELPEAEPLQPVKEATGSETIMEKLKAPEFSILKSAIEKASTFANSTGKLSDLLSDPNAEVTFFSPDNTAILTSFALLGLPANPSSLDFFSAGKLDTLLKYHLIGGQVYTTSKISASFPNMYLQSSLVLAPPSASLPPGLRMPIFLGKAGNTAFVNSFPITGSDIAASNGVMHKTPIALLPPDKVLWQTIATDTSYSYFKAGVEKADEGDAAKTLQTSLSRPEANLTLFVPTNAAMRTVLISMITAGAIPSIKQLYIARWLIPYLKIIHPGISDEDALAEALVLAETEAHKATIVSEAQAVARALAATPAVFNQPQVATVLTPEIVKGLVSYHILGVRAYLVNLPTTQTNIRTLLNTAAGFTDHPGVGLQAGFGAAGVTAATVKGFFNATPANILINPLPNGTSDQNFINGVIHRIDQVLLPIDPNLLN